MGCGVGKRQVVLIAAVAGVVMFGSLGHVSGSSAAPSQQGTATSQPPVSATPTPSNGEAGEGLQLTLPDLITLPPFDFRVAGNPNSGRRILRFANAVANVGEGPIELLGERVTGAAGFRVSQQLYGTHGEVLAQPILPIIIYHPDHGHWHLDGFARYELWSVAYDGSIQDVVSVSGKISYCLIDSDRLTAPNSQRRTYASCSAFRQGISAGWSDTYRAHLANQWVDISGLPDGLYALRSVADPYNHLRESDDGNNEAVVLVRLRGNQVTQPDHIDVNWGHTGLLTAPD